MQIQSRLFFGVALAMLSALPSAFADSNVVLFYGTSDALNEKLEFNLTVDANSDATAIVLSRPSGNTIVPIDQLSTGLTYESAGKKIITLSSQNFSSTQGGDFTLTYLNNGINNTYRNFQFSVGRQGQNWTPYVINSQQIPQAFTSMYLKAKKMLGNVIGIDSITVK